MNSIKYFLFTALTISYLVFFTSSATRINTNVSKSFKNLDTNYFKGFNLVTKILTEAKEKNMSKKPIGEIMAFVGLKLIGIPYVGGTLDIYDNEKCSINMNGLDCVTFFESALAISRLIKEGKTDASLMMNKVEATRYRNGKQTDYASRLHYTSDWIYDNVKKKNVKDITQSLKGATRFKQIINFMGTHQSAYKQLKNDTLQWKKIIEIEKNINKRKMYYVPKSKVLSMEKELQSGDIIAITTSIAGLDCSHTGMCYRDSSNTLRFLHASLTKKQVTLDDRLSDYLGSVSKHTGIMVARPI